MIYTKAMYEEMVTTITIHVRRVFYEKNRFAAIVLFLNGVLVFEDDQDGDER